MERITLENYIKAIYHLSEGNKSIVTNKQLALSLNVIPATVTEALKKLAEAGYIEYEKSYGSRLNTKGLKLAMMVIRRHRLWETYLVKELGFGWEEVHEIAEELEHIDNVKLVARINEKLGNPLYDPHGDPIPDEKGKMNKNNFCLLSDIREKTIVQVVGVKDHSAMFLKYCEAKRLVIDQQIQVEIFDAYDETYQLEVSGNTLVITEKIAQKIIIKRLN